MKFCIQCNVKLEIYINHKAILCPRNTDTSFTLISTEVYYFVKNLAAAGSASLFEIKLKNIHKENYYKLSCQIQCCFKCDIDIFIKQGIGIAEKSQETRRDRWGGNVNHKCLF